MTRLRQKHPATCAYAEHRLARRNNKKDLLRCLKRAIAREVYHALTATP